MACTTSATRKSLIGASSVLVALTFACQAGTSAVAASAQGEAHAAVVGAGSEPAAAGTGADPSVVAFASPPKSWIGGPCTTDSDCGIRGGRCLPEPHFPGGHCTARCKEVCPDRAGEPISMCKSDPDDDGVPPYCVSRCDYVRFPGPAAGCREGYECVLAVRAADDTHEAICAPAASGAQAGSAPLSWRRYRGGRQALVRLRTAPFPHDARARGYVSDGVYYPRAGHYDDPSAYLIVPNGFVDTGNVDLVVHFHGFNGDIRRLVKTKKLRAQFFAARRNAVMVLVQGAKNVPDSHPGNLGERGGLRNLVAEVLELLHADGLIAARRLGKVALTSHSGGYRSVAAALDDGLLDGRVSEVYLFDSFYGEYRAFFDYVKKTKGRFISIVTSELAGANAAFKARLRAARVGYATDLAENERVTFLRTNVSHAATPRGGKYELFLKGGHLAALPPRRDRAAERRRRAKQEARALASREAQD